MTPESDSTFPSSMRSKTAFSDKSSRHSLILSPEVTIQTTFLTFAVPTSKNVDSSALWILPPS